MAWTIVLVACGESDALRWGGNGASGKGEALVISEIHYRDPTDDPKAAFVEIHNPRASEVDLAGWCLKGLAFCFDGHTPLDGGGFLRVDASESSGSLASNGERLRLVDDTGRVHDDAMFGSTQPWPEMADGWGYSLQRRTPVTDGSKPSSWIVVPPSPGAATPSQEAALALDAPVVVNEIFYRSISGNPDLEFIELSNTTGAEIDISGWCVRELRHCFVDGTTIDAGKQMQVTEYKSSAMLPRGGGWLTLVDATGDQVDRVAYDDKSPWPSTADGTGLSLQRRDANVIGWEPGNWAAAEPTPGRANRDVEGGTYPMFDSVDFTRSPLSDQQITVTAAVRNGGPPRLVYRTGFDDEKVLLMTRDAFGGYTAEIPPQPSGTLVRFRLESDRSGAKGDASGTTLGTWPRQGDGMVYSGTVVWSETDSPLGRLQWFMPDDLYETAYADVRKRGDDGYPAVIAYDGEVFDNATIRIKGQNTRELDKRKWKVVLPVGYRWDMGGTLTEPVNEFALHSMSTDRAMINELLTYEVQKLSGGMAQQVVPLRLERNGDFYGLYLYVEQDDGIWRSKYGFSPETVVYEGRWGAQLPLEDLGLDEWNWTLRYRRVTHRYVDDRRTELADLITSLAAFVPTNVESVRPFVYRHVDIPSVVEAIATMNVTQNFDWGRKNWSLLYDPQDEKWRLYPTDHDLSFGRRYRWACGITCSKVEAVSELDFFEINRLGTVFLETPEFRAMDDRRTREFDEHFYSRWFVEDRLAEWGFLMGPDAILDRTLWPTFGDGVTVEGARRRFTEDYLAPKRDMILPGGTDGLPEPQPASPRLVVTSTPDGDVKVTNNEDVAIDLSGMTVEGLGRPVPAGVVLNPGQSAVFSNRREPAPDQPRVEGRRRTVHVWVPAVPPSS